MSELDTPAGLNKGSKVKPGLNPATIKVGFWLLNCVTVWGWPGRDWSGQRPLMLVTAGTMNVAVLQFFFRGVTNFHHFDIEMERLSG